MILDRKYYSPVPIRQSNGCIPHPYHPSVVYVNGGFSGHRFWMAETPYPPFEIAPYIDRYELPCIHYSDDGLLWESISENPIDNLSQHEIEKKEYYSDPHLILKEAHLELYYRYTVLNGGSLIGNKTILYRRISEDGHVWSKRVCIADLRNNVDVQIWGEQIISPAIIWTGKEYLCWYVDASHYVENRGVRLTKSIDGIHWSKYLQCELRGDDLLKPWHIDVQQYGDAYWMMMFDVDENLLSCYQSVSGIVWDKVTDVLRPSGKRHDFYGESLYRACSVKVEERIWIYFSAQNELKSSIGLLQTSDWKSFKHISPIIPVRYVFITKCQLLHKDAILFWKRSKKCIKRLLGL